MEESSTQNSRHIIRLLIFFLWLVVIHSLVVGLCLILFPPAYLNAFGFEVTEKFFPTQAGVFHLIMVVIYVFAIRRLNRSVDLVQLSIGIKFLAAIFLFVYYFLISDIVTVVLSGAGDLSMGIILLYLFIRSGLAGNKNAGNGSRV